MGQGHARPFEGMGFYHHRRVERFHGAQAMPQRLGRVYTRAAYGLYCRHALVGHVGPEAEFLQPVLLVIFCYASHVKYINDKYIF